MSFVGLVWLLGAVICSAARGGVRHASFMRLSLAGVNYLDRPTTTILAGGAGGVFSWAASLLPLVLNLLLTGCLASEARQTGGSKPGSGGRTRRFTQATTKPLEICELTVSNI